MLILETIAKIRRAFFVQGKSIKLICRELNVSRKVPMHDEISADPTYQRAMERITVINEKLGVFSGVPDAPFKTTWPELAMKRMIRYAAENGYEKVAWTTGETQAARYDLSKQVERIVYAKDIAKPGSVTVTAFKRGSSMPEFAREVPAGELDGVVGKELAEKITASDKAYGEFSGLDLKVGGEGMK